MEGIEFSSSKGEDDFFILTFNKTIEMLNEYIDEDNHYNMFIGKEQVNQLETLIEAQLSGNKLYNELNKLWNQSQSKQNKLIIKILSGLSVKLKDLLVNDELSDYDITKIDFSDSEFEESVLPNLSSVIGEAEECIINLKKLFDWIILKKLLGNSDDISSAMIRLYNKHKSDLTILKSLIKRFQDKNVYNQMFRNDEIKENYVNYVRTNLVANEKKHVSYKKVTKIDFYKYVKKVVNSIDNQDIQEIKYILNEIENDNFLPKLKTRNNAILPYQLHHDELKIILDNCSKFYPFLKDEEDGLTNIDKIKQVHTFRIPYYVGPLNDYHAENGFAWVERKEKGEITPWNFQDKVDIDRSAEKFISRMTNKCTYLKGKDVLPKCSLLYSEFRVLNELNSVRINGERLPNNLKEKIFSNIFKTKKKVTQRDITNFLLAEGFAKEKKEISISGIDGDFKNDLSSYIELKKIFSTIDFKNYEMIEKIIFYLTVFEENSMAIRKIKDLYNIPADSLKKIKQLKFTGWGTLSKEFLDKEVVHIDDNAVHSTIISVMRSESLILQEVLYDKRFEFARIVNSINKGLKSGENQSWSQLVDEAYVSPAVKRSITQAVKITNEVRKIINQPIDRIFIEFTRKKEKKGKTTSRREKIVQLFKMSKVDASELLDLTEKLSHISDQQLRSDRLFFYFLQLGKCAYTNQQIDLDNIFSNTYDIDHIIPQSILKDDSLNNRVLVYGNINKDKTDIYPVPASIQAKMLPIWKHWKSIDLLSEDKFARLTRKTELTVEEIGGFINRQLVFTNQATKSLAEILTKLNPETRVVYSKASNVSEFRNVFDLHKCREINDLHHAEDAYLNIVVGNIFHTKFGYDATKYILNNQSRASTSIKRMCNTDISSAWKADGVTLATVKKMVHLNNKLFTKMTFVGKGMLYDETIYPRNEDLFPRKEKNTPLVDSSKYGGFKSLKNAYFCIVSSDDNKSTKTTIEAIPILYANKIQSGNISLENVLIKHNNLVNPRVLVKKVLYNTLVEIEDITKVNITGKSGSTILIQNNTQIYADYTLTKYFRNILKYIANKKIYDRDQSVLKELALDVREEEKDTARISAEDNIKVYDFIFYSLKKPFFEYQTMSSYNQKLSEAKGVFETLDVREQANVLNNMISLLRCNASKADLSKITDKAKFLGGNTISKNITNLNVKLIDQSVTGFYERVRWSK